MGVGSSPAGPSPVLVSEHGGNGRTCDLRGDINGHGVTVRRLPQGVIIRLG